MKSKDIIKNYCSNNPKVIVKIVVLLFSSIVLMIGIPILLKFIIEMFTNIIYNKAMINSLNTVADAARIEELTSANHSYMVTSIILVISLGLDVVLSFFVNTMKENSCSKFGSDITENLRSEAYNSILKGEYYEIEALNTKDVTDILIESTDTIGNKYIGSHFLDLIYYATTFVATLVLLFCFNVTAGLVVMFTVPAIYVSSLYIGKFISKQNTKYDELVDRRDGEIANNINNLKEIKIRNGMEKEAKEYIEMSSKIRKNLDTRFTLNAINDKYLIVLFSDILLITLVSTFIFGVYHTENYSLSLAIAAIMTSPIVYNQFNNLLRTYFIKLRVSDSYKKLDTILDLRPEARNESLTSLSDEIHTLTFNNVSFEYNLSQKGVDKVSFELQKGEKLGILGYQHSGKTTLVDLITKIIRPRFGNILINNCDINKLSTAYLREIVAYVPQNYKIFDGTIEENITYPHDIDEYKYNDALNKCKLKTLLMNLPKRDQENALNINLSPADIERIGLANAFYKDSPIIILDEATNKLDNTSEKEILEEFFKLKNKMMIITSSRIATLTKCDKILILNDGKVVEFGKTTDLLSNSRSAFSKMMNEVGR